jgi:hypothetical protein
MAEQLSIDKSPRSTRQTEARKRSWVRPNRLDAPPAPPGFKHRWIRAESAGREDRMNVASKLREGYELVRAEDHPDFVTPSVDDGRHAGVIGVGGLVLAKIPDDIVQERNAYYQQQTKDQIAAVDNDLMKANAHSSMVIERPDRKSRTSFGSPKQASGEE